jgi:hypothetical protein
MGVAATQDLLLSGGKLGPRPPTHRFQPIYCIPLQFGLNGAPPQFQLRTRPRSDSTGDRQGLDGILQKPAQQLADKPATSATDQVTAPASLASEPSLQAVPPIGVPRL